MRSLGRLGNGNGGCFGTGPDDDPFFNALGADPNSDDTPVDQHAGRLEVRHEAPDIFPGRVPADPAFFLGFTFVAVSPSGHGAFTAVMTSFCHSQA